MGYFNYFIKCIIRNIAYKLCKPKVLLTVLLCVVILLFCFKNYGYCTSVAEGQYQLVNPNNDFIDDSTGEITGTIQYDNQYLSVKAIQEEIQRAFILRMYAIYSRDENSAVTYAKNILNQLYNGATSDNVGMYIQMAGSESQFRINYYRHKELSDAVGYGVYVYNNMFFGNVPYQHAICPRDVIDNNGNIVFSNAAAEINIPVPMIRSICSRISYNVS